MTTAISKSKLMGKKGAYNVGATMGYVDKVIALIVIMALVGSTAGLMYVYLGNVTDAITANDTTGLGTVFTFVLPILLLLGIVGVVSFGIAKLRGGK